MADKAKKMCKSRLLDVKLHMLSYRTKELAETSEICSVSYDTAHILQLFQTFQQQSARTLLFLKNVAHLNFYVQHESDSAPQKLYTASAKSDQVRLLPQVDVLLATF